MSMEYRPCIVSNKYKALFHCWQDKSQIIPPSVMQGGHGGGAIRNMLAIVECEDGSVHEAYPYEIRFLDNKLSEYCFCEPRE